MTIQKNASKIHTVPLSKSLAERLSDFRAEASLIGLDVGEHQWTYYDKGNHDNEALLLLSGGGADAEAMFAYIEQFSMHFRVIAPNLPPTLKHLNDTISGLHAILAHENIDRVIVVGLSFGAILAQLYIRRFQNMVADLIITHAVIPSKHLAEPTQMQKTFLLLYPEPLLIWTSKRTYQKAIAKSITPASDETRQFWQTYFSDIYGKRIRKRHVLSRARLIAQYHSENEFNSRDLLQWQGDLLIIESEQDDVIRDGDRGSLKAMYSRAYVQTLQGYDHLAPILRADTLISSIINFLHKED